MHSMVCVAFLSLSSLPSYPIFASCFSSHPQVWRHAKDPTTLNTEADASSALQAAFNFHRDAVSKSVWPQLLQSHNLQPSYVRGFNLRICDKWRTKKCHGFTATSLQQTAEYNNQCAITKDLHSELHNFQMYAIRIL